MNKVYKPKVTYSGSALKPPATSLSHHQQVLAHQKVRVNSAGSMSRPRSRSVYTTSSYLSDREHLENGGGGGGGGLMSAVSKSDLNATPTHWSAYVPKPIVVKNYYPEDSEAWSSDESGLIGAGTTISPHGVVSLRLRHRIRVDIALDRAVRIVNTKNGIFLGLSASGSTAALIHPNGRVYQYGSRVEIIAHDAQANNKYAKMWHKGVSFTSDQCALVYLVDAAGTRTTTDTFTDLSGDISYRVFHNDSMTHCNGYDFTSVAPSSSQLVNEAVSLIQSANYWVGEGHTDNWILNSVRISQTSDGLVRVGRNSNKFSLRTSATNGSASISSPYLHCTGSMGQTRHLFVRRGERRMHYDGTTFIVRNAGHSAGFDERHQLKVY